MAVDFNVNEEMNRNKYSRYFIWAVVVIVLVVFVILAFNGKHNKLPFGTETNIPAPVDTVAVKKDTVSIHNDHHVDNSKKVEIKDNHGKIGIKM